MDHVYLKRQNIYLHSDRIKLSNQLNQTFKNIMQTNKGLPILFTLKKVFKHYQDSRSMLCVFV